MLVLFENFWLKSFWLLTIFFRFLGDIGPAGKASALTHSLWETNSYASLISLKELFNTFDANYACLFSRT